MFGGKVLDAFMVVIGVLFILGAFAKDVGTDIEYPINMNYASFILGIFLLWRAYKNFKGDHSNIFKKNDF
tara:strand:+ start:588 stop:797 length:210 start_codon:yes stop_codon:yes gene_type:complete